MRFIDACAQGFISWETIYDHIDSWHFEYEGEESLSEYLGMTWEEYGAFVEKENSLVKIIEKRKLLK